MTRIGKTPGRLVRGGGAYTRPVPSLPVRVLLDLPLLLLILLILFSLTSCAPSGKAVGDTWKESDLPHQGEDTSSLVIALIGRPSPQEEAGEQKLDGRILSSLRSEGLEGYYWQASSAEDQQAGVEDAVRRGASLILLDSPASGNWISCLGKARHAGIPVAIIQEGQAGSGWRRGLDSTYYAAILKLSEKNEGDKITTLSNALKSIIDDGPHDRTIQVTLDDQGEGSR